MVAEPKNFTRHEWTYEKVSSIEDDVRRELHDGVIFEMPSPTLQHQDIVGQFSIQLMLWARQFGGRAFLSPLDLYLSPTNCYIPDVTFYSAAQMSTGDVTRDPKRLHVPPALIVEVLSDSTVRNDRVRKLHAYAQFGVANYWIVDPEQQILEAFELRDGLYQVIAAHAEVETFTPSAFPELQISLSELFAA